MLFKIASGSRGLQNQIWAEAPGRPLPPTGPATNGFSRVPPRGGYNLTTPHPLRDGATLLSETIEQPRFTGNGFAAFAIKLLSVPRMATLPSGPKVLGGAGDLSADAIDKCYCRMANFVHLVIASLKAENPSYELIQAFNIFRLDHKRPELPPCFPDSVQRVAMVFGADAPALRDQILDARHSAMNVHKQSSTDSHHSEAWATTLRKLEHRKNRQSHPHEELANVMHNYQVFCGCTTSGVEQGFATTNQLFPKDRALMSERIELGELKLFREPGDAASKKKHCEEAQRIWEHVYGEARKGKTMKFSRKRQTKDRVSE